ncbi:HNH endonuclease signature motif containing protein [Mycolicibacterium mageritense]|uniref:HNH nuclease domain-containing protein n=2 Tax=Mycolicibacterium mageritense TaxID=53462 RepID=A0AAI8TQ89_MYCME|nr:DUF222 domain-containing protein [Mycolicibacterium mageritense]BDY26851.1 hypothetical protein hbim_00767 [Mycolicibacterium mageritense]
MFEDLDDAALAAGIEAETRAEAAAACRRLAMIAALADRRLGDEGDERQWWVCDGWDAAAAEVAVAMGVGQRAASTEMTKALALRDRLPAVAALFARGALSARMVAAITWRTHLVDDPDALAAIDAGLAERAVGWEVLSKEKLEGVIDALITRHDPGAVRRTRRAARERDVCFGKDDDVTGTTAFFGRLLRADAVALRKRVAHVIGAVCADDPRTLGQRRSDAVGVIAVGGEALACRCGNPECPAAGVADARAAHTVVYILADPDALSARSDPYLSGDHDTNPIPWDTPAPADTAEPDDPTDPTDTAEPDEPDAADPVEPAECADAAGFAEPAAESMDTTELADRAEPPDSADLAEPAAEPPDSAAPAEHTAEPMDSAAPAEHTATPMDSAEPAVEPADTVEPEVPAGSEIPAGTAEPAGSAACAPASPAENPVPPAWSPGTAVVVDGGVIPTPLLADLIAAGATVKHLDPPGAEPEPRYRPSAKLAAWVRMRDMTCMFPGCDRPAERCDVDHTEPYPGGPTHPSNTKCLCRIHHLLKTFWAGWHDKQYPDGTVEWTTPSGRTYVKKPGAGLFFPHWDTATAALPPPGPRIPNDGTTMPRRTRTRAAQRARRKHAERALNGERGTPPY